MDKKTLQLYIPLQQEIEQLEAQKRAVMDSVLRQPALSGMPSVKGVIGDPVGTASIKLVELQKKIDKRIDSSLALLSEIEDAISCLEPRERMLIRKRYVEGKTWERIAVETSYSESHVRMLGSRAERSLQKISIYKR